MGNSIHTNRGFMPTDKLGRYTWAGNHITGLEAIGASLGTSTAFITQARADWQHLGVLYGYRDQADALARKYTQAIDRFEWDEAGEEIVLQPVDAAELGNKTIKLKPGFYRRLLNNIDVILKNHSPLPEETQRQLFILPVHHAAPDLLSLSADALAKFTGGVVILSGHLPKPAKYWRILVDRGDGKGKTEAATIAAAKFTDHHPLPDKPTSWTYTVELLDKDLVPLGKVSVTSLTVWRGAADQGPEAGR